MSQKMVMSTLNIFFFKSIHSWDPLYSGSYVYDKTIFDKAHMIFADYMKIADLPQDKNGYLGRFQDPVLKLDVIKNPAGHNITVPTSQSSLILPALTATGTNAGPLASISNLTIESLYTVMSNPTTSDAKIRFLASNLTIVFFKMSNSHTITGAIDQTIADSIVTTINTLVSQDPAVNHTPTDEFKNMTYTMSFNGINGVGTYTPISSS